MPTTTYGIIADIHANNIALKIALEQLEELGVEDIICTGDVVGYGGCPNETISLLKKYKVKSILGNHDFYLLAKMIKNHTFEHAVFLPDLLEQAFLMKFREIALIMFDFQEKIIKKTNLKWLGRLPISQFHGENRIFVIHGAPPVNLKDKHYVQLKDYYYTLMKYLFPWDQENLSISCYLQPAPNMVVGHTHMQFAHQSRSVYEPAIKTAHPCLLNYDLFPIKKTFDLPYPLIINPGSVGQSRDEIDAPGYATLTLQGKQKRTVTWYRFKYDFDEFTEEMKRKNAPPEIFDRKFWAI
jgi:predicted phosphodiesterase